VPRFRLTLAYDGTGFAGWQSQAAGERTVQDVVQDALARISGGVGVAIDGAGRTDTGVHAEGQVASFALPRAWEPDELVRAANAVLPPDVRALQAARVGDDFHARRSASGKMYRYLLDTGAQRLPQRRHHAAHVPFTLDADAVRAAAAVFVGRHDFAAVASAGSSVKTTVRTLTRSEVSFLPTPGLPLQTTLVYEVEGDGFLRKMVRSLVGGLVACGRGPLTPNDLRDRLAAGHRAAWPPPADPCGLTLVRVDYPPAV
jgi:tRNA pseudouridine38-40 synthase